MLSGSIQDRTRNDEHILAGKSFSELHGIHSIFRSFREIYRKNIH